MKFEYDYEKYALLLRKIVEAALLTLLICLTTHFTIQNFHIDGTSMEPGLHNTELLLVDKWTYLFHPPARGDVIVFIAPPSPTQDYVKRVIGLPGDVITIRGTTVIVDGITLHESYVALQNQGIPPGAHQIINLVVPANDYFVLGDNRAVSSDSRIWGFVPRKNIIGRAALLYWPLHTDNTGLLPNVSAVFAGVHSGSHQNSNLLSQLSSHLPMLWLLLILLSLLIYWWSRSLRSWPRPSLDREVEQGP
jgi:signal peptidase I